jgi:hypothetical protein
MQRFPFLALCGTESGCHVLPGLLHPRGGRWLQIEFATRTNTSFSTGTSASTARNEVEAIVSTIYILVAQHSTMGVY